MNKNHMEILLNNALCRITELENVSVNNNDDETSSNNQSASTAVTNTMTSSTTSRARSRVSSGSGGLTEELQRSFPSLRNSSFPSTSTSTWGTRSHNTGSHKKKRKRGSVATSQSKQSKPKPKAVYKDLVLIPDPDQTNVPTHSARVFLESKGYVLHSFPFVREWDSIQLKKEIKKVFPQIQSLGYEYLKPSYGKLVRPNLASGVDMTCQMLMKLSGQGSVYIRSSVKLSTGSDSELSDNDDLLTPSFEVKKEPVVLEIPSEPETEDFMLDFSDNVETEITELMDQSTNPLNPEALPLSSVDLALDQQGQSTEHPLTSETLVLIHPTEIYPVKAVTIHRVTIKKDMIELFQDQDILKNILMFTIIGYDGCVEKGEGVGLAREALTSFWQQFSDSLTLGVQEKVPVIRHDHHKVHWEAIARILIYGYVREKYFPLSLSLVFVASCLFEEESLTDYDLLQSFRMYISDDEREAYDKCVQGDISPDDDEVLELLSSYKCYRNPNPENILSIFSELAHQELIQKPKYVVHCWSPHVRALKSFPQFQTLDGLKQLYEEKRPTGRKLIKLLKCEPATDTEQQCLDHLKRYIKSLQGRSLTQFLQFVTGSDIILTEQIKVAFVSTEGFARRPIAHTCAPLLELPSTYQCYNDLAEEFTNILADKLSWSFSIV